MPLVQHMTISTEPTDDSDNDKVSLYTEHTLSQLTSTLTTTAPTLTLTLLSAQVEEVKSWITLSGLLYTPILSKSPSSPPHITVLCITLPVMTTDRVSVSFGKKKIQLDITEDYEFIEQDEELIDEAELIDDSDWIKPTLPLKKEAKKKACKDCSCGLKELELSEDEKNVLVVTVVPTVKSSCGNVSNSL